MRLAGAGLLLALGAASPARAQPGPTCADRGRHVVGRLDGDVLRATRGAYRVGARGDVNLDGHDDVIVTRVEDGQPDCGSYGECATGLLVWCARGRWAPMIELDYRFGLRFAPTSTRVAGVAWVDLHEEQRVAGSALGEATRMDAGLDPVLRVVWHATPEGYSPPRDGVLGVSDECARARRLGRPDGRSWCETALRNARALSADGAPPSRRARARMRRLRGAILYELGRIAEAAGEQAEARRRYEASLRERRSLDVQARLRALEAR